MNAEELDLKSVSHDETQSKICIFIYKSSVSGVTKVD